MLAALLGGRAGAAEPPQTAVDAVINDALKAWRVPGAALVVVKKDSTILLKGYGTKRYSKQEPVTADTIFPLASCTKAFTTTLAGMLVDDGIIGWDDLVQKHLPAFRLSDPNADALVSLRDLFTHRTGVKGHDLLWYHAPWNIDETVARAGKLPQDYPFRSGFEYNTIMYMAAGRALAAAADEPWEKMVRERITQPLGMKSVHFTSTTIPKNADRAMGHIRKPSGAIEEMPPYELTEPNPAGSMFVTARDLAAWLKFLLAGGSVHGRGLISEASLKETRMPQNIIRLEGLARRMNLDTHSLAYGLGWIVSDHRGKLIVAHGGVMDGFRIQITFLPEEGLGFALLNNLHETRMNQAITNALIDLYCKLPPRDWNAFFRKIVESEEAEKKAEIEARNAARQRDTRPTLDFDGYAGEYMNAAYGTATIANGVKGLVLTWSSFRCSLEHWENDMFRISDGYFTDKLVKFAAIPGKPAGALHFVDQDFVRKREE